jgi:hypothetical protein
VAGHDRQVRPRRRRGAQLRGVQGHDGGVTALCSFVLAFCLYSSTVNEEHMGESTTVPISIRLDVLVTEFDTANYN